MSGTEAMQPALAGGDSASCPRCGFVDGLDDQPINCSKCEAVATGKFCSTCGSELETGHVVRRAMRTLFAPLVEYAEHARSLIRPSSLVHEIRNGHFTSVEVTGFWVAAVLVATLISAILPSAEGPHIELPIIAEAVEALLIMALTSAMFAPAHLLLRIGHRDVTLREFLMTSLAIGALLHPWLALSHGILVHVISSPPGYWTAPITLFFYASAFAILYRRKVVTVLAIIIADVALGVLVLLALLFGVALIFKALGYIPDEKPARTTPVAAAPAPRPTR